MITLGDVTVHCDQPGCDAKYRFHPPTSLGLTGCLPSEVKRIMEDLDWIIGFKLSHSVPGISGEDFCPKHGRCSWCRMRMQRRHLTKGRGPCEGQIICAACISRREA